MISVGHPVAEVHMRDLVEVHKGPLMDLVQNYFEPLLVLQPPRL